MSYLRGPLTRDADQVADGRAARRRRARAGEPARRPRPPVRPPLRLRLARGDAGSRRRLRRPRRCKADAPPPLRGDAGAAAAHPPGARGRCCRPTSRSTSSRARRGAGRLDALLPADARRIGAGARCRHQERRRREPRSGLSHADHRRGGAGGLVPGERGRLHHLGPGHRPGGRRGLRGGAGTRGQEEELRRLEQGLRGLAAPVAEGGAAASPSLKSVSKPGEAERDFRVRLQESTRQDRDRASEALARSTRPRSPRCRSAAAAPSSRSSARASRSSAGLQTAISVGATILGAFLGRKTITASTIGRATTAARAPGAS